MSDVVSVGLHLVVQTGCLHSFHVFRIALELTSNTWIAPVSSPATSTRPSYLTSPECAVSSNRVIVLSSLRVRWEKICTRGPVVTANVSGEADTARGCTGGC